MIRMLPLVMIVACGDTVEDTGFIQVTQTVEDGSCNTLNEQPLGLDEEPPDIQGWQFSAAEVLSELEITTPNLLSWPDGLTIDVMVGVTYVDGEVVFVQREIEGIATGSLVEDCFDAVEIGVDMSFATGDGIFDEAFPTVLRVQEPDLGTDFVGKFTVVMPSQDLMGTWTPEVSSLDAATYGEVELGWTGYVTALGSNGEIKGQLPSDPEAPPVPIAEWIEPVTQGLSAPGAALVPTAATSPRGPVTAE